MDTRGIEAAGTWIEMAQPTYPCLVDVEHRVADLYNMVNVPQAVWIDEDGRIVRPTETAGSGDEFRTMMEPGGIPPDGMAKMAARRAFYADAIRDWVRKGASSDYVFSAADARAHVKPAAGDESLAAAHFRLGRWLAVNDRREEGLAHMQTAVSLRPESWNYRRQMLNLTAPGDELSGGPPFWAAVEALGEGFYYEPVDMPGIP